MSRGTKRMNRERMTGRERLSETWESYGSAPVFLLCIAGLGGEGA